jgi:SM-20-related protein
MATAEELARLGVFAHRAFLSPNECASLSAFARDATQGRAYIVRDGESQLDERFRRGACVDLAGYEARVQERLLSLIRPLEDYFNLHLSGCDRPKVLVYRQGDFFRAHRDRADDQRVPAIAHRRISAVTFLEGTQGRAPPYGGGELVLYRLRAEVDWDTCRTLIVPEPGLLVAFKSDVFHEVKCVRWGERHTIVTWFHEAQLTRSGKARKE